MKSEILWLWLQNCTVTRAKQHRLLNELGDISAIYSAGVLELSNLGFLSPEDINSLINKDLSDAEALLKKYKDISARVIPIDSEDYPKALKNIHQPPTVLYARGSFLDFNSMVSVAMVGTRKPSNYGRQIGYNIARELSASGVVVVSGLAMGIDAKCHEGALSGGSPTVAVIGSGVDIAYPRTNAPLMKKIMSHGAVISEYPLGKYPEKYHFPERNRIIAGMTKGTVVVEADLKSGSLITARYALEENRDVFSVPGNINSMTSKGTNYLLKDGAYPLTSTRDVLDHYGITSEMNNFSYKSIDINTDSPEGKILSCIGDEAVHTDTICQNTGLDAGTVNATLMMLEIKGKIIKLAGGYYTSAINI